LEAELVARVGGVGRAVGPGETVEHGIASAGALLFRERVGHCKRRVVAADDLALRRSQMLDISVADEPARASDNLLGKSGDLCNPGGVMARGSVRGSRGVAVRA